MHPNTMQRTKTWVQGPMGRIGCVRCKKSRRDFVARTFALIALVHPILHRVSCSYKLIPNASQHYATHQNMSLGSMGRIGCVCWKKSRRDFVARTLAFIATVDPVLHRVSCSYETIPNAPKHYATHQNMSLGSNVVVWVHLLKKIPMWLRGTNFCINCTSWPHFSLSFMQLRNNPKCTQTLCNARKHKFRVQGVDWVRSLQKIPTCYRGTNFYINCTSWPCFAPSFMLLRNDLKCTQTLCNAP